jgi:hypothetical protein
MHLQMPLVDLDEIDNFVNIVQAMQAFAKQTTLPPLGSIVELIAMNKEDGEESWARGKEFKKISKYRIGYSYESKRPYIRVEFVKWYQEVGEYDKHSEDAYLGLGEASFSTWNKICNISFSKEDIALMLTSEDKDDRRLGQILWKQCNF